MTGKMLVLGLLWGLFQAEVFLAGGILRMKLHILETSEIVGTMSALNYPLYNINERMRFAAWKIIQLYYAVFSAVASLVCLDDPNRKSHDVVINRYLTDFICNSRRRRFFLPPTNFHLNQQGVFSKEFSKMVNWKYADCYHLPTIEECLNYTKQQIAGETNRRTINMRIGILHYLKILRDWVNYQDAYLFFRLYGNTIKFYLDFSLKRIAFIHCVQTEFFLLKTFGWKPLKLQFKTFQDQLKRNLGIKSPSLEGRFRIYSANRRLFE